MGERSDDTDFLALLVHRGVLGREAAQGLLAGLSAGRALDELLVSEAGLAPEEVQRLRRTRAGEVPELPGFEILGRLGQGGTADVWRAREKRSGRVLALKVLRPSEARRPQTLAAFVREAKLLAELDHPGLVKGFGAARHGELYLARLEAIEGETLLEHLERGDVLPEAEALRLVLEVAEALAYLESAGLVHRDVKPGNVMRRRDGRAVLIDLGFAAQAGSTDRGADSAVGTVAYLSPEQARGGAQADARSDIYSLGISLFQLVVGRLPFEARDDRELLRRHLEEALSSPELRRRGISPHLHYFVGKMTAKEAAERFQSFAALIQEIRSALDGHRDLDLDGGRSGRPRRRGR